MLTLLILAAWAAMSAAPDTTLGRALRRGLVEAPARALGRITWRRTLVLALLLAATGALIAKFGAEGLLVFGQAGGELVAWTAAFDFGTALDLLVVGLLALVPLTALRRNLSSAARFLTQLVRPRARRSRPAGGSTRKQVEDEPGGWRLPLAA
jgi:hypothetical protein